MLNGSQFTVRQRDQGSGLDKYDVAYFTACCDPPETVARYAEALKLDYPILSDPTKQTAKAYGVVDENRSVPHRWTFFIDEDGKIAAIDKDVNAASHAAAIVDQLDELGVPKK